MWRRLFDVLFWLGVSVYFGGMVAVGAIVAPAVFDAARDAHLSMPGISPPLEADRQAGGEIFGVILNRFAYVEAVCLVLILIGIAGWLLTQRVVRRSTLLIAGLWLLIALTTAYDAAAVRPRVWNLRDALRQSAAAHVNDAQGASWPERSEFDALHARSEMLGKIKAYALLAMVLIAAWRGPPFRTGIAQMAPRRGGGGLSPPPSSGK